MNPWQAARHFFRRYLLENIGLKILSLFIGFSMWFLISSEQQIEKIIEVPVEIVNKPAYLDIANDYTKSVIVQIMARQDEQETVYKARIDLADAHEGENVINLTDANFDAPPAITIESIRPSTISILLETRVNKTVPVSVQYTGVPADNFEVLVTRSSPETIPITGPVSHVNSVNEVYTQSLDISNRNRTVERMVSLIMENPFLNIQFKDKVRAVVQIQEKRVGRRFRNFPVTVVNLDTEYRLRQRTATLNIQVVMSKRDLVTPEDLQVYVDGNDCAPTLDAQNVPLRFRVRTPQLEGGVFVERIVPDQVQIRLLTLPQKPAEPPSSPPESPADHPTGPRRP
ncbi:MAG: YbbR-like domain-containing protein [Acidobacteria bacterium]|nr:YbbR-like domain-containing protein [Acidobacteriota bacterium]